MGGTNPPPLKEVERGEGDYVVLSPRPVPETLRFSAVEPVQ